MDFVKSITELLTRIDDVMYYPVLVIIMAAVGLYFTVRTRAAQIRLIPEALKLLMEPPESGAKVSSLQAMLLSTASRVGTGNIIGVSTAICMGGPGSCFWMWVMCIIAASSSFVESTLAQIYKVETPDGMLYGGPAYYIEHALHAPWLAILFCVFQIATFGIGSNLLCSYNLQSTFCIYDFYDQATSPFIIGCILAIVTGYCFLGGGTRIVHLTTFIVPFMGLGYVLLSLIVILFNIKNVPLMLMVIFKDAFNFRAILGGISGSCVVYGIKRGLFSNEAGLGSAPNASASAKVSHPAKQGLFQTLSVYIDTLILCTATAFMCLVTGVHHGPDVSGAPYVQNAVSTVFGQTGPYFITLAMALFAFTTMLGNLFYVDVAFVYLNGRKMPSRNFMNVIHLFCAFVILIGAIIPMNAAWAATDISMGSMALINLPVCILLGRIAIDTLNDYEKQLHEGRDPVFKAENIGLDPDDLSTWK